MPKHFFITNREVSQKGDKNYLKTKTGEYIRIDGREPALQTFRVGSYTFEDGKKEVSLFPEPALNHQAGGNANPDSAFLDSLGSGKLFRDLHIEMSEETDNFGGLLFFIHGYNNDLNDALEHIEKLHEKYIALDDGGISHIVLFTWPSEGNVFQYRDDNRDAEDSGVVLARVLQK